MALAKKAGLGHLSPRAKTALAVIFEVLGILDSLNAVDDADEGEAF
jgi:hypothetical protein